MEKDIENDDLELDEEEDEADLDSKEDKEGDEDKGGKKKDDRPKLSDEELLEQLEGRANRLRKKLGKDKPADDSKPKKEAKPKPKSDEFGYGELAYLTSKGYDHDDDIAYIQEVMRDTNRSLKDVLASKHVQAELKERKETRETKAATPEGTRKSKPTGDRTVEHWLEKGGLPPNTPENTELRRKIVNARAQRGQGSGGHFYNSK